MPPLDILVRRDVYRMYNNYCTVVRIRRIEISEIIEIDSILLEFKDYVDITVSRAILQVIFKLPD